MLKIKYYDIGSSREREKNFNTVSDADVELTINGFKFDINKKAYVRRQGNYYQEAVIVEV